MKFTTYFALAMMLFTGHAQAQDWDIFAVRSIGVFRIGPNPARHSVGVRRCANDLTHVKLMIKNSGVVVLGAGVTYTDGAVDEYSFNKTYPEGYESSWLNLDPFRSEGRCINSVFVKAQSTDANTARVEVYGNFQ